MGKYNSERVWKDDINPLTLGVKPWVIQSFLTLDFMDRFIKCEIFEP